MKVILKGCMDLIKGDELLTQTRSLYSHIPLVNEKETRSDTQRLYRHIHHIKGEGNYSLEQIVYMDIFALFMKGIH